MTEKLKNATRALCDEINQTASDRGLTITLRAVQGWASSGAPLENRRRLITWLLTRKRLAPAVQVWLQKQGTQQSAKVDGPVSRTGPTQCPADGVADLDDDGRGLFGLRVEFLAELKRAKSAGDLESVKYWTDRYVQIDESIRRTQAHEKKLGLDQGEVLPRPEAERMLRAAFHAGNASIEDHLDEICKRVVGFDFPEEAYAYLKPILLGGRLFSGFGRLSRVPGPPAVPLWLIDLARDEADNYLEGAEVLFQDEIAEKASTNNENEGSSNKEVQS